MSASSCVVRGWDEWHKARWEMVRQAAGSHYDPNEPRDDDGKWTSGGGGGGKNPEGPGDDARGQGGDNGGGAHIDPDKADRDGDGKAPAPLNQEGLHEITNAVEERDVRGVTVMVLDETGTDPATGLMPDGRIPDVVAAVSVMQDWRRSTPDGMRGWYFIRHLGSTGQTRGAGTEMVRLVLRAAARKGVGVFLESTPGAVDFYERLGFAAMNSVGYMPEDQEHVMGMRPEAVRKALKKLGPPKMGARKLR